MATTAGASPGRGDRLGLRRTVRHQGPPPRRRRRDDGREDHPPPLPAAALPGRDRHPVRGRDRPAYPRGAERAEERQGAARRGHRDRPRGAHGHLPGAGPRHRHAVRLPDRGGRCRAVLLRQRPVRRVRTGHEEHRRRARAARPDLRRLRDGRARRHPRRQRRPPADVRGRRCGADRRGDGRPDRRARAPHAEEGLPGDQHPQGPGDPRRRRRPGAAAVRRQARPVDRQGAQGARRRGDARRDGHRRRRARPRGQVQGRPGRADRRGHQGVGGGRAGQPARARPSPSRPARRWTDPAGSASTPTSRCRAIPRCSWSAT